MGFPEAVAQYIPLAPQKRMNFSFQTLSLPLPAPQSPEKRNKLYYPQSPLFILADQPASPNSTLVNPLHPPPGLPTPILALVDPLHRPLDLAHPVHLLMLLHLQRLRSYSMLSGIPVKNQEMGTAQCPQSRKSDGHSGHSSLLLIFPPPPPPPPLHLFPPPNPERCMLQTLRLSSSRCWTRRSTRVQTMCQRVTKPASSHRFAPSSAIDSQEVTHCHLHRLQHCGR